jgi:hypothetical protein
MLIWVDVSLMKHSTLALVLGYQIDEVTEHLRSLRENLEFYRSRQPSDDDASLEVTKHIAEGEVVLLDLEERRDSKRIRAMEWITGQPVQSPPEVEDRGPRQS